MSALTFIGNLLNPHQNGEVVIIKLCQALKVQVSKYSVRKLMEEHPDYQSLLSIKNTLESFGIVVNPINVKTEKINLLPTPFIAQKMMPDRQYYFTVVYQLNNKTATYFDPIMQKKITTSFADFKDGITGVTLLVEPKDNAGEKTEEYKRYKAKGQKQLFYRILAVAIIPVFTIIFCLFTFIYNGVQTLPSISYTLLILVGTVICSLLIWYEIDHFNPALRQICSIGKKMNCDSILSSKASRIFGISWGEIGFTYFAGSLVTLLVSGIYNSPILYILSWLNIFALPYTIFSVYYQASVAKQWCILCLSVQVLLVLQFIIAFAGNFYYSFYAYSVSYHLLFTVVISFLIPFLFTRLLIPAFKKVKENKANKIELGRMKNNPQIFEALLSKQKAVSYTTERLGITIGKADAKYKIIKVCNPYCGPCAEAHQDIEALLEKNSEIQVQIIFTATGEDNDIKTQPVRHLLAIADKNNEAELKKALDDWYLADKKEYETFANKYPINGELKLQDDNIKAMHEWCNNMSIVFTPTFFLNQFQLPEMYSVADLKYFLAV